MNPDSRILDQTLPAFKSRFTASLPGDPEQTNRCRQVDACYSYVEPTPVVAPKTIAYSLEVATLLELPIEFCQSQAFADVMAGNRLVNDTTCKGRICRIASGLGQDTGGVLNAVMQFMMTIDQDQQRILPIHATHQQEGLLPTPVLLLLFFR